MSYIGPVTKDIVELFVKEVKKKDTKEKIMKNLIDPIIAELFKNYSKYIVLFLISYLAIILMLIYIIFLVRK